MLACQQRQQRKPALTSQARGRTPRAMLYLNNDRLLDGQWRGAECMGLLAEGPNHSQTASQ